MIATCAGKPNMPRILVLNPTVPTVTSCGLFLLSHLPKNPQQTPQGRNWSQTTHGLTQHSFLYCCPEGRDFTALCIPQNAGAQWHQEHGKGSLWTNPSSASTSTKRFLTAGGCCAHSHSHFGLPCSENRDGYLQEHDESASIHAWHMPGVLIHGKRTGESVVWVWRQSGLELMLPAKTFVCNGFTKCSIQTHRTVTPLRAETHWEKDLLSQVTLPETSDTV